MATNNKKVNPVVVFENDQYRIVAVESQGAVGRSNYFHVVGWQEGDNTVTRKLLAEEARTDVLGDKSWNSVMLEVAIGSLLENLTREALKTKQLETNVMTSSSSSKKSGK